MNGHDVIGGDSTRAEVLAQRLLSLVDIPSPSRAEEMITDHITAAMSAFESFTLAERFEDCVLYLPRTRTADDLVVFAGHTDTVPAQGNLPGRIEDGAVHGLGACDMKAGLTMMIEIAGWLDAVRPAAGLDAGFMFFGREELPVEEMNLPGFFDSHPDLGGAELVVMMEPTANAVQTGCQGNLSATLTFRGETAHSARPWLGTNAISEAVEGLRHIVRLEPMPVEVDGLQFIEVVSITSIRGGLAHNVIPDLVTAGVNYRYPPSIEPADAETRFRELMGDAAEVEITGNSRPAPVESGHRLVRRLCDAGPFAIEPKQAWTPVAEFAARGFAAINFGPGDPVVAHKVEEHVPIPALVRCFEALQRFIAA